MSTSGDIHTKDSAHRKEIEFQLRHHLSIYYRSPDGKLFTLKIRGTLLDCPGLYYEDKHFISLSWAELIDRVIDNEYVIARDS